MAYNILYGRGVHNVWENEARGLIFREGRRDKNLDLFSSISQKIIKIIATRCYILRLKNTQFDYGRTPHVYRPYSLGNQ